MKESQFIKQNKEKWSEFEQNLKVKSKNPSRISQLFIQITDDLSFARTFYKNRSVRVYLNGVAQLLFNDINRSKKNAFTGFVNFWRTDLPLLIHEARAEFRISLLVFIISMIIGMLSSAYDKDFCRLILGDEYVEMTIENIQNNNPMAVYKKYHQVDMFLGITLNNTLIAFRTFVTGIFLAIGTLIVLVYNGIMLGTFQYFFIERGLFKESFLTIWQHGTLEISAIIIAGAAGLTLGKGLLFPGTYTRVQSFKISAVRGLKILLGILPILFFAGFIEGFFTRYTELPNVLRLIVIIVSLTLVIGYYVYYPIKLSRKKDIPPRNEEKVNYKEKELFDFQQIKSSNEILGFTFSFVHEIGFGLIKVLLLAGVLYGLLFLIFFNYFNIAVTPALSLPFLRNFIGYKGNLILMASNILALVFFKTYLFTRLHQKVRNDASKITFKQLFTHLKENIFAYTMSATFINSIFFLKGDWPIFLFFLVLPVFVLSSYISFIEEKGIINALSDCLGLLKGSWIKFYASYIKFFILAFALLVLLTLRIVRSHFNAFFWNFNLSENAMSMLRLFVVCFIFINFILLFFSMVFVSTGLYYYTLKETITAESLVKRIRNIGKHDKLFGYDRE